MNNKTIILLSFCMGLSNVYASGDMTAQHPIEVKVSLGSRNNQLRFYPDHLRFETGKLYKLVIDNPSRQKHYFSSSGLAKAVFTRKVQVVDTQNRTLAEVKGVVSEIEVYPGNKAEWWFVPVKTIKSATLHCSIKGHTEAGMKGRISVY